MLANLKLKDKDTYVMYYPLNDEQKKLYKRAWTDLKIRFEYYIGGMNYFSGSYNKRGYRVSWKPVCQNGFGMEESVLLSADQKETGAYLLLSEATRFNKKKFDLLAEEFDGKVKEFAVAVINDRTNEAIEIAKPKDPKMVESVPNKAQKNLCAKTVTRDKAYEVWQSWDGSWTWYVLKKWQADDSKPEARWFCDVVTPICPDGEMGDVWVSEIKQNARRIK